MKALVGAFNQEKALVGAFSVIVQPVVEPMEHYTALLLTNDSLPGGQLDRVQRLGVVRGLRGDVGQQRHLQHPEWLEIEQILMVE